MLVYQLRDLLKAVPGGLEIVVRCEWDADVPNGNCFMLRGAVVQDDHSTGEDFLALDCDQEMEDG